MNLYKYSSVKVLTFFIFVGLSFGVPIFGAKFSFSNLVEIVVIFLFLFSFREKISVDFLTILFLCILFIFFSYGYVYLKYSYFGKPIILIFFVVSIVFFYLYKNFVISRIFFYDRFLQAIRVALVVSFFLYLSRGIYQFYSGNEISFFMDDKSHASVILCFFSFLSLIAFKKTSFFFSFSFLILTFLTISRLSFVFVPFILLFSLNKIFSENKSKLMKAFFLFILIVVFFACGIFVYSHMSDFKALQRISSMERIKDSKSTIAHFVLLQKAIDLKVSNVGNFILGVSPGNFADILVRSNVDYSMLESLDPKYIRYAFLGKAPVHSTFLAIFCEFPLLIFIVFIAYWLRLHMKCFLHKNSRYLLYFS